MCRVSYIPTQFVERCSEEFIIKFLKFLETSNGGDGNGFYYLESRRLEKSVKKPLETLYNNPDKEGFVFHTRRRSHGPINKFLCHPFETEKYITLHNGIWSDYQIFRDLYEIKQKISDSYIMGLTLEQFGIKKFFKTFSQMGVVIIYEKDSGKVYCAYTSGDFEALSTKYGYIYASTFHSPYYNRRGSDSVLLNKITKKQFTHIPRGFYELSPDNFFKVQLDNLRPSSSNKILGPVHFLEEENKSVERYGIAKPCEPHTPINKAYEMVKRYDALKSQTLEDVTYHLYNIISSLEKKNEILTKELTEFKVLTDEKFKLLRNDIYEQMANLWENIWDEIGQNSRENSYKQITTNMGKLIIKESLKQGVEE